MTGSYTSCKKKKYSNEADERRIGNGEEKNNKRESECIKKFQIKFFSVRVVKKKEHSPPKKKTTTQPEYCACIQNQGKCNKFD
jgi:hypothetical protein